MTQMTKADEKDGEMNGRSLLENLNSDVELYHKKVLLKRMIERNLEKERETQENVIPHEESKDAGEEMEGVQDATVPAEEVKEISREINDISEEVTTIKNTAEEAVKAASKADEDKHAADKHAAGNKEADDENADNQNGNENENGNNGNENVNADSQTPADQPHSSSDYKKRRGVTIPWSKTEDDAIVYYKEEMKYSWKRIEELLKHRHSWQAIQMRYLRNHKSRNEEWSRYMEIKLINNIRKDWENRWRRISADLGKDFSVERCMNKNIEICKKMEIPYYSSVFENKDITQGYENPFHDIKDPEQHKKLMLVYMGLDSISYEDAEEPGAKEE
ncbi:hypothetical protein FOA43_001037 [Brettanomyces nanus]|uniref:Myb-like domain-containing protein n=1 Tax=Eeniella nana TaxID=13502 RepID=A0A875S320_EENNA|nr:uncharacterized protein FOA43_001037 [Brettanomyces nanus]QPG73724.1 hypothetical protein FOA43_001037 [Brettanomyces nanus]